MDLLSGINYPRSGSGIDLYVQYSDPGYSDIAAALEKRWSWRSRTTDDIYVKVDEGVLRVNCLDAARFDPVDGSLYLFIHRATRDKVWKVLEGILQFLPQVKSLMRRPSGDFFVNGACVSEGWRRVWSPDRSGGMYYRHPTRGLCRVQGT